MQSRGVVSAHVTIFPEPVPFGVSRSSCQQEDRMKRFIVLYSGGKAPTTQQEGETSMKQWRSWFGKLGSAVVEAGAPFAGSKTVTASGAREGADGNVSNGYSVLQSEDIAGAAKLVKDCPIIGEGGKVHIFDLLAM